jgi:aryl-alcohol dehydrogenase-like predicted oxidoreductase
MSRHATSEGTQRYAQRFAGRTHETHFRMIADAAAHKSERQQHSQQLAVSTLGIGTYLGNPDEATDRAYTEAIVTAVESGFNVLDSAINYRLQRSERSIGAALAELAKRGFARDEILICTKAGFLTPDGAMPADPGAYFRTEFISRGILKAEEIAAGCHSMAPRYLADQLERSLRNMGVECLDVFYLHNPETQLAEISRGDFLARVGAAFMWAESMVSAGKICAYGMATWNGFRVPPDSPEHISLAAVEAFARQIAGDAHHFRFVQLPVNLAMTEALTLPNQELEEKPVTMVEAAGAMGIQLIGSAALLQGKMARKLPDFVAKAIGLENDAERALQFARSVPGMAAALVGMSHAEHVRANARLFSLPLLDAEQFARLFSRGEGA